MKTTFRAIIALACSAIGMQAVAQSTALNEDGTVTFSYKNPKAKEVQVDVQFAGRHAMTKGKDGVWTATLGPAAPDMYPYQFVVDGVSVMDPENPQFFPNEGFKNSLLEIPGNGEALLHTPQNVPHGSVEYVKYWSEAIKAYNNAIVYTPPTYERSKRDYPVFYLISGTTDTEEVYYKVGRMNVILDNLIAQGKAQEMIIVLPYGNPAKIASAQSTNSSQNNQNNQSSQSSQRTPSSPMTDLFSKDLVEDLMPYIDSHYRTITDRDYRAIGGFSRGGNQGLMNGLVNIDKFSYLCSYSSFTSTDLPDVYDNAKETNQRLHLFWSGVGTDDFLYGNARDYTEFLDKKGIRNVKEYTTDKFGHTWMNAKYFLGKTLPLLFNPDASEKVMAASQPTKAKTGNEKQFTPSVMARLFPRQVVSPEMTADGVIFRIKAEKARKVLLSGEMLAKPQAMKRDKDGVWEVTLKGLPADVFCYNFIVDGTPVADAQNMYLEPARGFKRSILDLTAKPEAQIEYTPVRYMTIGSTTVGMVVPKAFSQQFGQQTSVPTITSQGNTIILKCGPKGTVESWHKIVKANEILDQMIAAGQCKPCALMLVDGDLPGSNPSRLIDAANYKTWSEARKTLINTLKGL